EGDGDDPRVVRRAVLLGLPRPPGPPPARGTTAPLDDPRLRYLAPEEAWSAGTDGPDARPADVFALGATLYHLLTGRPPYAHPDPRQALADAAAAAWAEAPLDGPRLPADVRRLVRRAMSRDPAARPPTAEAFVAELDTARRRGRELVVGRLVAAIAIVVAFVALVYAVGRWTVGT
ncbi:MAG TPA: hypothetical protein VF796_30300, partial [Humisphaera sp.]